jgi:hypothetical protein
LKITTNVKTGNTFGKFFAGQGNKNNAPFAQPYTKNLKPIVKVSPNVPKGN